MPWSSQILNSNITFVPYAYFLWKDLFSSWKQLSNTYVPDRIRFNTHVLCEVLYKDSSFHLDMA